MSKALTMQNVRAFFGDDSGATAIEYALIASGIAGAIIVVVLTLGTSVQTMYQNVDNSLN